jgi:signal transduction histidine kinase
VRGHVERVFLHWARPLAPALCIVVYGLVELVRPDTPADRILLPLALSVVAALAYLALLPRLGVRRVLHVLVVVDTLLIAAMTAALGDPEVLAIAYFWSIAVAAFFLGFRTTIAATALAAVCAATVPFLDDGTTRVVVVVTDVLVLVLIGGLLALFARQARLSDHALREASRLDAAALRIAEQVRSTLEAPAIVRAVVEELARETRSARGLCRLLGEDGTLHQWTRPGVQPVEEAGLPASVARVAVTGRTFVVPDRGAAPTPEVLAYMERHGIHALVAVPIIRQGEVIAVIGLHHDAPRRWQTEIELVERVVPQIAAALAQAEAFAHERRVAALRERLIANVSHELRTPLTSTIGFLQTIAARRGELAPEDEERFLAIALEQAQRLARLVEELLDLAALEARKSPTARPVPVRPAIERATRELAVTGRSLTVDVPDDLVARADDDRLVQVFSNLIRNAIVHGEGDVRVSGSRLNGRATIVVADEGPGIPERLREEVFIPFARWNEHTPGTGLGLPISRAIVESYGGTLVYDGAFVVSLPAV